VAGSIQKHGILAVGRRYARGGDGTHPDAACRAFIWAATLFAHPERAGLNEDEVWQ
jgi:hypothetical protein